MNSPSPQDDERRELLDKAERLNDRQLELRGQNERLQHQLREARSTLLTLHGDIEMNRRYRLAALNLIEDAEEARRRTEAEAIERQRAEDELHESEARLRLAMEAASMGAFVWHIREVQVETDAHLLDLFGLPAKSAITPKIIERAILPEDKQTYREALVKALDPAGNGEVREDVRIRFPDGAIRWLAISARVHFAGVPRQPVRLAGTAIDVTDRKLAEEQLRLAAEFNSFRLRLSDALRPLAEPEEIQLAASRVLGETLRANRVGYAEALGIGGTVVVTRHYTHEVVSIEGRHQYAHFGEHLEARLHAGETVVRNDIANSGDLTPEQKAAFAAVEIGACVNRPLVKAGRLEALLFAHFRTAHEWTREEIAMVEETAERTWDAVQRARAEAALRESEVRLRRMADAVPQIIWTNAGDGTANYFNLRWYEYTGLTYAESRGPGWQAVVHPNDAQSARAEWERAQAAGDIMQVECRLRGADGSYRWFIGRNIPSRDASGKVTAWFGTATDIHDVKQAQEALAAGEERFRVALEAAEMAAWDYDVQHDRVIWNDQHFRVLGLAPDGKAKRADDFLRAVHPDDLTYVTEQLWAAVEETGIYRADFRIVRADNGEVRWMSGFGRAMERVDGRVVRMTGVMFDTTDRHRAEETLMAAQEHLRLLVDSALEHAILTLDLNRRVTSWNRGAEVIFQYAQEEMIGRSGDILFIPDDIEAGAPAREQLTAMREGRAGDNRWKQRKDGSRFWANGAMLPMRPRPDGPIIGFVKILRDETETQQAREAVERSRMELWEALQENEKARAEVVAAGQAKDHFLAVLSHELRTPLMPVMMATHTLMRRKDLPEAVRDALEMIRRNIQLESRFVDDLLDVTRIERGKMELVRQPMDLHEAITHAVEVSRPDIDHKQQRLTVALDAQEHGLTGDFSRLQQVIWNLLKNASKFTPEEGEISIRTYNDGGCIYVEVTDSGIGIEPQALPQIFTAFTQASVAITREFGGLGLGLAIAKASVLGHGGELRAHSAGLNRGATFTVVLPLQEGHTCP